MDGTSGLHTAAMTDGTGPQVWIYIGRESADKGSVVFFFQFSIILCFFLFREGYETAFSSLWGSAGFVSSKPDKPRLGSWCHDNPSGLDALHWHQRLMTMRRSTRTVSHGSLTSLSSGMLMDGWRPSPRPLVQIFPMQPAQLLLGVGRGQRRRGCMGPPTLGHNPRQINR